MSITLFHVFFQALSIYCARLLAKHLDGYNKGDIQRQLFWLHLGRLENSKYKRILYLIGVPDTHSLL